MKVCASYGTASGEYGGYGCREFRMDVFEKLPETDENTIIALCGKDAAAIPKGFRGIVDNGTSPIGGFRNMRSVHDFGKTPDSGTILKMMDGECEITKGAFLTTSFSDLHELYETSQSLKKRHILIGMGGFGTVSRIRSDVLRNEFGYGFVGKPTAPGQLSAEEMERIGDGFAVTGIVGSEIGYTESPAIQNAAMAENGIDGRYLVFDTPSLDHLEDAMREYRIKGLNITKPYKIDVMRHLDSVSEEVEKIGAVNTIVNENGSLVGYNTDYLGIKNEMKRNSISGNRALVLGSGGAARAAVYCLREMEFDVAVAARNRGKAADIVGKKNVVRDRDVSDFDVIIGCIPPKSEYTVDLKSIRNSQAVIEMAYSEETELIRIARRLGCRIVCGKDILVSQAAESFLLWFGVEPDREIMRKAIG